MQHYILLIECNRIVHILYQFMLFIILPIFASCLFLISLKTKFFPMALLRSLLLVLHVLPIYVFTLFSTSFKISHSYNDLYHFLSLFLTQIPSSFLLILFFSFITCQTIRGQIPSSESSGDDDQRKANFTKAEIF